MLNRIRNSYAAQMFAEIFSRTELIFIMGLFVVIAGAISWILMRGMYGKKIVHFRYIFFWMTLTQILSVIVFDALRDSIDGYDGVAAVVVRLSIWILLGLVVSALPLINTALQMDIRGRFAFLVLVHIVMRILLFTLLGFLFAYGLQYPKLLSKIVRIAPACKDALCTIAQML